MRLTCADSSLAVLRVGVRRELGWPAGIVVRADARRESAAVADFAQNLVDGAAVCIEGLESWPGVVVGRKWRKRGRHLLLSIRPQSNRTETSAVLNRAKTVVEAATYQELLTAPPFDGVCAVDQAVATRLKKMPLPSARAVLSGPPIRELQRVLAQLRELGEALALTGRLGTPGFHVSSVRSDPEAHPVQRLGRGDGVDVAPPHRIRHDLMHVYRPTACGVRFTIDHGSLHSDSLARQLGLDLPFFVWDGDAHRFVYRVVEELTSAGQDLTPMWRTYLDCLPPGELPAVVDEEHRLELFPGKAGAQKQGQHIACKLDGFQGNPIDVRLVTPFSGESGSGGIHCPPGAGTAMDVIWSGRFDEEPRFAGNTRDRNPSATVPSISLGKTTIEDGKLLGASEFLVYAEGPLTLTGDGRTATITGKAMKV